MKQAFREVSDALVGYAQGARVPRAAGSADDRGAGRPPAGRHPLSGRRDQLSRSARRRHAPVRRGARARRRRGSPSCRRSSRSIARSAAAGSRKGVPRTDDVCRKTIGTSASSIAAHPQRRPLRSGLLLLQYGLNKVAELGRVYWFPSMFATRRPCRSMHGRVGRVVHQPFVRIEVHTEQAADTLDVWTAPVRKCQVSGLASIGSHIRPAVPAGPARDRRSPSETRDPGLLGTRIDD